MPDTIPCPQCGRRYVYRSDLIGRMVQCQSCGRTFRVPGPAHASTPAVPSPAMGASSSPARPEGPVDAWSQPLGGPPAEAVTLGRVPPRRRRRMKDREKVFLGAGVALAASSLGLLLLLAILGIASGLAVAAGSLVGLAGVGLAAFALRGNPLAACTTGAGMFCAVLLAAVLQPGSSDIGPEGPASEEGSPQSTSEKGSLRSALGNLLISAPARPTQTQTIPPFPGETSRDPVAQMTALVHLMEAIRGESSLQELEPRILALFGEMLQAEAAGRRVTPDKRLEVEQALPQFDQRMVAASERLEVISGGVELRRKLVKLMEERPLPQAATRQDQVPTLPTIASWVVWGWATPRPPEPPEDRQRRRKAVEAAGRNPDAIRVYVRGVTSDSMADRLRGKVLQATHGIVVAPVMAGEVREFRCGKIQDFRKATYRLDVGPIVKIEHEKAILHVQLDPSKLYDRPRDWVAGPIPLLFFDDAGIPAAPSVALPDPPEPAELRTRREDIRWDAGLNLEGVDLVLYGSNEDWNRRVYRRLAAMKPGKGLRTANAGFLPATIHCDDVGDMRVFAPKLDFGTIIRYDDERGLIHLVVDPARIAPPQLPESAAPRVAGAPEPPEPADVRARRQEARRKAGLNPDEVDVSFPGLTDEQAKDMSNRLLAANVGKRIVSHRSGNGPWRFRVREVTDMRLLAEALDFGTILEYDDVQGRIVVRPDAAKLDALPPPPAPAKTPPPDSGRRFDPRRPPRGLPFPRPGPRG